MGRIDEALQRAERSLPPDQAPTVVRPAPGQPEPGGQPFESPWNFDESPSGIHPVAPEGAIAVRTTGREELATGPERLAVFGGFDPRVEECLAVGPKANAIVREQYRRMAATLHHAQLVQGTKVLMVTSALPGDGKSLTATNLALTLSESYGREVLLIDADLRRPSLHTIFQVPNVAGLNEGLKAGSDTKLSVVAISGTLTLLPAGRPNPDPMSHLTSARLDRIVREATARFNWVIIDTAPVGLLADANLISAMVDGAIIVIGAGKTPHATVSKAVETIGRERILGVVLNGVEEGFGADSSYAGYTSAPKPA
jgi:capsular exopolysaccharide synthesis family protein